MQNKIYLIITCLLTLMWGCYKEKALSAAELAISMTGNQTSIPADGASKQLITVEIPSATADANNSITLTTTKGVFDIVGKNTITVAAQNIIAGGTSHKIASVNLISSTDEGIAYVTATIKNYSLTDTIIFTKAYAEQIKLSVDKLNYQISNTNEIVVAVKISRLPGNGTPTPNQNIMLAALDNSRNPVGRFRNLNIITDASGSTTNYFSIPLTTPYTGIVKILTTVQKNSTGDTIADSAAITAY